MEVLAAIVDGVLWLVEAVVWFVGRVVRLFRPARGAPSGPPPPPAA